MANKKKPKASSDGKLDPTLLSLGGSPGTEQSLFPALDAGPVAPEIYQGKAVEKRPIEGVPEYDVEAVLGVVNVLYLTGGRHLPSLADIIERCSVDAVSVKRILSHPEFKRRASVRGISWPANWDPSVHDNAVIRSKISAEQSLALSAIVNGNPRASFQTKLKNAGISQSIWANWMRDPLFNEAVRVSAEEMLNDSMAAVHSSVVGKAQSGDINAAKLYYELTGRHDPNKQQMLDFGRIVTLLLEVLQRHVTDAALMRKINDDLDLILSGGNLKEIDQVPANYEGASNIEDAVVVGDDTVPDGFFDFEGTDSDEPDK